MPKLRTPPSEIQKRELIAKIRYGMVMQNISLEALALTARVTSKTLYNRFNDPDGFRLGELRRISAKLHIPLVELLGEKENK